MISLSEFKRLIGSQGQALTDIEVEQLRADMYKLADMAFDIWTNKQQLKTKVAEEAGKYV